MKKLLLPPALLATLPAAAQDTAAHSRAGRLTIGASFSPDYSYRTLKHNGDPTVQWIVAERNAVEIPAFRYTAGLQAGYALNRRVTLEAGIQYSRKGYNTKRRELQFFPHEPDDPIRFRNRYRYHYLDIPLQVRLTLGRNRLRFSAAAGVTANILLWADKSTIYEFSNQGPQHSRSRYQESFRKPGFSPMISAGADYRFTERSHLNLAPVFRYSLTPLVDAPVKGHLWSAGLQVGYYRVL